MFPGFLEIGGFRVNASHDSDFDNYKLLDKSAAELEHTVVTAHLEYTIEGGKSIIWCATFQLAWNEACALLGEDIHLDPEPTMVPILNKKTFTKDFLDEESYVALAGYVEDDIYAEIEQALEEKFGGDATPKLLEKLTPLEGATGHDIIFYAYLFKNLEFAKPFEELENNPLIFEGVKIECFGQNRNHHLDDDALKQVAIYDYNGPDDFIIELKSKQGEDQIVLAKVNPKETLETTIAMVVSRMTNSTECMCRSDVLKVPKLNFNIWRQYTELLNAYLVTENPYLPDDIMLHEALQNIRFQMNEKGVKLRSEAGGSFGGCGGSSPNYTRYEMVFDQPYLIMLKRKDAPIPYFALWVDNPEMLTKAD